MNNFNDSTKKKKEIFRPIEFIHESEQEVMRGSAQQALENLSVKSKKAICPVEFDSASEKTKNALENTPTEQKAIICPIEFVTERDRKADEKSALSAQKTSAANGKETIVRPSDLKAKAASEFTEAKKTSYATAQILIQKRKMAVVDSQLYVYNGYYYERYLHEKAVRLIAHECRSEYASAGTKRFLDEVYSALLAEPVLVREGSVENNVMVSFQNGMLNLRTHELTPHSAAYFTTYGLQCPYARTECPVFDRFIGEAMEYQPEYIERVYQMIGYILSPDTHGKFIFVLQGCPHSGKSVLSDLLISFFNPDAVFSIDVHDLGNQFATSNLVGKVLCISPDLPAGPLDARAVSRLKQLTGHDMLSSDVKYKDRIQFYCHARFLLATNHPFVTKEADQALIERIIAIPFSNSVPRERQNAALLTELKRERSGIAFKAIAAYYRLVENQYRFAGEYQLNSADVLYQQNNICKTDLLSNIYSFLLGNYEKAPGSFVFIEDAHGLFSELYGTVALNTFSQYFTKAAEELFEAGKIRKRKAGEINPKHCIDGIRYSDKTVIN